MAGSAAEPIRRRDLHRVELDPVHGQSIQTHQFFTLLTDGQTGCVPRDNESLGLSGQVRVHEDGFRIPCKGDESLFSVQDEYIPTFIRSRLEGIRIKIKDIFDERSRVRTPISLDYFWQIGLFLLFTARQQDRRSEERGG